MIIKDKSGRGHAVEENNMQNKKCLFKGQDEGKVRNRRKNGPKKRKTRSTGYPLQPQSVFQKVEAGEQCQML